MGRHRLDAALKDSLQHHLGVLERCVVSNKADGVVATTHRCHLSTGNPGDDLCSTEINAHRRVIQTRHRGKDKPVPSLINGGTRWI